MIFTIAYVVVGVLCYRRFAWWAANMDRWDDMPLDGGDLLFGVFGGLVLALAWPVTLAIYAGNRIYNNKPHGAFSLIMPRSEIKKLEREKRAKEIKDLENELLDNPETKRSGPSGSATQMYQNFAEGAETARRLNER